MRKSFSALLCILLIGGCSNDSPSAKAKTPPAAVLSLAEAYIDSLTAWRLYLDRDATRDEFLAGFLDGFVHPRSRLLRITGELRDVHPGDSISPVLETLGGFVVEPVQAEQGPYWHGNLAGQEYRLANPTKVRETMEGFGYAFTEVEGIWTVGFEHSGLYPADHPERGMWWLSQLEETESNIPDPWKIPEAGVHVRASGYLSPAGQYGHLGNYRHEFYATRITRIDGD